MRKLRGLDRRQFLTVSSVAAAGLVLGVNHPTSEDTVDTFIQKKMKADHIPGVAACIVNDGRVAWSRAYGWANIDRKIAMTTDHLQNVASISKTFTTTALMQLWEKEAFRLDDDVNDYLPFAVRNPSHPKTSITFRHLLTHRSSIKDGTAYSRAYACGDPRLDLGSWLKEYLGPDGRYYDAKENFHPWKPGERWNYCNVSYGLLGYLVEEIAGTRFSNYCRANIFEPLEMVETSWYLADIDPARHAVPYTYVTKAEVRGPSWGGLPLGVVREESDTKEIGEGYQANCLYNHPNFPDGFLRTSVMQLSRYLRCYLNNGVYGKHRLLQERTIREMLSRQVEGDRVQGLTWYAYRRKNGDLAWGHGGSDPGVNTDMRLLPSKGLGAIVFTNTNGIQPQKFTERLLQEAESI